MAKQKPIGFLSDIDETDYDFNKVDMALFESFESIILSQYRPAENLTEATDLMSSQEVRDLMQAGTISAIQKTLSSNGFKQYLSGTAAMWMMERKQ